MVDVDQVVTSAGVDQNDHPTGTDGGAADGRLAGGEPTETRRRAAIRPLADAPDDVGMLSCFVERGNWKSADSSVSVESRTVGVGT
jgi:hypothetical protein